MFGIPKPNKLGGFVVLPVVVCVDVGVYVGC